MKTIGYLIVRKFLIGKCVIFLLFLLLLYSESTFSQPLIDPSIQQKYPDFESRRQLMLDSMAAWAGDFTLEDFKDSDDSDGGKYGAYPIMALYETGQLEKAREFTAAQLVGGAAMFREYTTMALYMEYHDLYGEELHEMVKQDQLKSDFFRLDAEDNANEVAESHRNSKLGGASENHKLMYAAAAYLAGLAWPDDYPQEWFQVGYNHLMRWFDIVTTIGFWEEDSPTYLIHHMGPILSVAEHAPEGSEMKRKATMVLEWYFLSIAGEYLHGYWITPAARDYNPLYGLNWSAETTALTWLYFGDTPQVPYPHIYQPFRHWKAALHFALSDFRLPDIITRIATDRDQPFVHKEFMAKNPLLPKEYCYLNRTYGLASMLNEEGRIVPDLTRWKLQWVANNPEDEPSAFFMKHPEYNEDDDEKWRAWRGASAAEQVLQHEDALVAVYKIEDPQQPFIDGPFAKDAYQVVKEENGWIFVHAGTCLFAVKAVNGLEIKSEDRISSSTHGSRTPVSVLESKGKRNGLIVQAASPEKYPAESPVASLDKFIRDVLRKTKIDDSGIESDHPTLKYTSLSGDQLEIAYDQYKKVNGKQLDFSEWPLLGNPWMHQDYRGDQLVLEHRGEKRVYDFDKWEIR